MTIAVPNQWPSKPAARRIACIGEAPGGSELRWHRCPACKRGWDPGKTYSYKCPDCAIAGVPSPEPFVGPSGWLLNQLLAEVGIDRAACFVGNVCQHNPPGNDITHFKWDGLEVQAGLKQLWADLSQFKPHFCLLLGGSALRGFKGHKCSIESWRGSLFCATISTFLAGDQMTPGSCEVKVEPAVRGPCPPLAVDESGIVNLSADSKVGPTISPPDCGALVSDAHPTEGGHAPGQAALHGDNPIDGAASAGTGEPASGSREIQVSPSISSAVPVLADPRTNLYGLKWTAGDTEAQEKHQTERPCECYNGTPAAAEVLSTRVVHHKHAPYDIYIGRPGPWGNPFVIGKDGTREEVIARYREWVVKQPQLMEQLPRLRGKVLGCWCKPLACHGDVLADMADNLDGVTASGLAVTSAEERELNLQVRQETADKLPPEGSNPSTVQPFQVKCLATYHPAALQRDYSLTAVVRFDVAKAAREARTDELVLPTRNVEIGLSKQELLARLAELRSRKLLTALDIEGGCGNIACIGFATSASSAFVVPFANVDGTSVWDESDEVELWEAVAAVLEDPTVPKIIMNALYELFVLAWTLGIVIRGLQDDIMLGHWELYCELEKALEFQASIYTNQPYWKLHHRKVKGRYLPFHPDGRLATSEEWYTYNGIDCCVTFECATVIASRLAKAPGSLRHYRFNMQLLMPVLYMELRGIRYDKEAAKAKLKRVERWIGVLQDMLNRAACGHRDQLKTLYDGFASGVVGQGAEFNNGVAPQEKEVGAVDPLVSLIRTHLCLAKPRRKREVTTTRTFKNGKTKTTTKTVSEPVEIRTLEDCVEFAKESCKDDVRRICRLLERGCRHGGDRSALAEALNIHVKVNSTGNGGDACWFLYEVCGFEKQFQKEGNRKTDRLASDDEALIKIWVQEQKKPQPWPGVDKGQPAGPALRLKNRGRLALAFLKLRRLVTATKTLSTDIDADGRMRCAYNVVGTETGRLTCYESPTGSGYNLQTTTKPQRHLFLADPGTLLSQCDLAGADGWTVAAYAAAQGDRTMLEDYRAGIKPAKVGVLMWKQGPAVNKLDRAALKQACKSVDGDSWEYFGFKRVQHGSSYAMGKGTMSDQILTDSWKLTGKPVFVPPAVCEQMQRTCFFARYWGIQRWHQWMEQEVRSRGSLTASNGFTRRFFGRKDDHATVKAALAHLPQVYTTGSTMMAMLKQWSDADNRREDGSLKCEILHTVHDSLLSQFPAELRDWVIAKQREWFANPVQVAGEVLTIPYECGVGPDWKHVEPV